MRPLAGTIALLACCAMAAQDPGQDGLAWLDAYDVVWRSPSRDAAGSMPIGNGEVGCNVWVEPDGSLHALVARTDSFSEASRLLKPGLVVVRVRRPQPGEFFEQRLCLREGCIRVTFGEGERRLSLRLFVDSDADVIHVASDSARDEELVLHATSWRREDRRLLGAELQSSWTMQDAPAGIEVVESADRSFHVHLDIKDAPVQNPVQLIGFHHCNRTSVVPLTLQHQGLAGAAAAVRDPLLHRSFGLLPGGVAVGPGAIVDGLAPVLVSRRGRTATFHIAAPLVQDPDERAFERRAAALLRTADSGKAAARTAAFWRGFWSRSWIRIAGEPALSRVEPAAAGPAADPAPPSWLTQALLLQRWVQAGSGRGAYPIKFNGSIFTVEPRHSGGPDFDADWRRWGDCFWWQNTRLPYHAMLMQGDFEMMEPLFRFYETALPLARERCRLWHGVAGAFFPETMTPFGTHANKDYGWDRTGREPGEVLCPWWCFAWNQGPELLALMLDRHDHAPDAAFVRERVLPLAEAVLDWFGGRFAPDERGRLRLSPTQALETYWHGVENDLPTVAGLHEVLERLLALPDDLLPPGARRERWQGLHASLPPLPLQVMDGEQVLAPAERFEPKRSNVENPELYAVWPFRRFGLGRPGLAIGRRSFLRRFERRDHGWTQDGQQAALLGLVDEAAAQLLARAQNTGRGHRFPAMWGPNFDWLPDQCHGSNLLLTAQCMLLQEVGDRLLLLPAWPLPWDVAFRLHGSGGTVVEVDYRGGVLQRLDVVPAARRAAVLLPPELAAGAADLGLATFTR